MKSDNIFYGWLTPLLAFGITLSGFILLKPDEPTAVYWINMVWLFFLEGLFFVWLRWGHAEVKKVNNQTPYFRIFLGVSTLYYIAAGVLWMVYYFFVGTHPGRKLMCIHFDLPEILDAFPEMSVRLYLFGILVLTVLWVVVASIVGRRDAAYNTQQTQLENDTNDIRLLVQELKDMAATYQCSDTERAWRALIRDAESVLPSQITAHKPAFMARAQKLINTPTETKTIYGTTKDKQM
ncbi:hypothetical protein [Bacteroides pyogenes]|uniref:hypothetical protein n=1 Tax=Bacteroides pyogenes TaxID=310300 RepID=UPI00242B052C|nr:hypothetical protein [uncultured Bacteroides sp.]